MIARLIAVVLLAGLLSADASAAPQTAAELLQRGIYAQETVGDLDAAIRIYRQLVDTTSVPREYAGEARFRLADCLLKKRDFSGAAQEFRNVVDNHPDQKDLVDRARARLVAAEFGAAQDGSANRDFFAAELNRLDLNAPLRRIGEVKNGRYRNNWTGLEFDVPEDWKFTGNAFNEAGEAANLFNTSLNLEGYVWVAQQKRTPADVDQTLRTSAVRKAVQREMQGFLNWVPRVDSVWPRDIRGRQAVTYVADFTGPDGQKMVEYLTSICTERTNTLFHMRGELSQLEEMKARLELIVESAVVP